MEFSAFLTSLGTSLVIFVVLMLIFTWLSTKPSNEVIYYPNRILRGLNPWEGHRLTRNPLAWIREAFSATEAEVVAAAGLDAAVYLVFLSSVLGILVLSGVVLLPVLLPLAATDNGHASTADSTSEGTFNNFDKLAMGNIKERSPRLWPFVLAVYWVSIVTFFVLWKSDNHVLSMRAAARAGSVVKPEDFAVLVRDIPPAPKDQTMKEHVDSYFKALHPETFYKSLIITENKKINKIWKKIQDYKKKVARAEAGYRDSKTVGKPDGSRPTNRTGFLVLIGPKVDTINYYSDKIKELLPKLEEEQNLTVREKQKAAALVFFNNRQAAASAAQTIHAQKADQWTVKEAPEPRDLIWKNLPKSFYQRQMRRFLVYGIVFLTIFFYIIPIGLISAFTTLDNLRRLFPFMKNVLKSRTIKTVLEAYLPQIALIVFLALLPKFLLFLSKLEGISSQSHVVRATCGKYFYFIVLNVFLGVTIGGTLFGSLKDIIDHPKTLIDMLAKNLPDSATFFITYVALKFFVGYGLELSRLVPLLSFRLKKRFLCKTDAEVREAWAPGDFNYATRVANDMLIVTIVICYSVIAPVIIPFGVVYFGLGWLIARNQALKVYVPSYESSGQMWPHMFGRIMAALIIFQITMFGYMGLKKFYFTPLLIPLLLISFIYSYICTKRFYKSFHHTPLEVASQRMKEAPNLSSVYASYIPPYLKPPELDDVEQPENRSQSREHVHDAQAHATALAP